MRGLQRTIDTNHISILLCYLHTNSKLLTLKAPVLIILFLRNVQTSLKKLKKY